MKLRKTFGAALLAASLFAPAALAETVIKVTLIDKLASGDLSKPLGLGMGMKANMSKAPMGVAVNPKNGDTGHCALGCDQSGLKPGARSAGGAHHR